MSLWRLDGEVEAADPALAALFADAPAAARRRLLAALRTARRRGVIKLRLSGGLSGWAAVIAPAGRDADGRELFAVSVTDQPQRLDAAVDGLMRSIAVESEGFWRVDARGCWLWSAAALNLPLGAPGPRPLVEAARRGRPVVDLCLADPSQAPDPSGGQGVWLLTGRPVWDEQGRPAGLVGFARSLWSWRRASTAGARLAGMAAALHPGFALYDADGTRRFAGDTYALALDCACGGPNSGPHASPGPCDDDARPRPEPGGEAGFDARTLDGRRWAVRRRGLRQGGWAETAVEVSAIRAAERDHAAAIGRARQAERAKQAFVDAVGGELLATTARINAALTQLRQHLTAAETARYPDFIALMEQGWRRLWRTARDVRAFNLLDSEPTRLEEGRLELSAVLASAVASLRDAAVAAGVSLTLRPGRGAQVRADARLIELALEHLLSNAVKFTPAGGHVVVSARETPEGGWALEVRDDGVGVASENLSRIHEPFTQADGDAIHRPYEGSGLGLALCRAVARLHGGRLEFSSALGAGATARLILPPERRDDPLCERERRRAEIAAADAFERQRLSLDPRLFSAAPLPLARLDAAGVVIALNPLALSLFGPDAVGRHLTALAAPGAGPITCDHLLSGVVERVWRGRGGDCSARASIRPLQDGDLLAAWEDDTEIRRLEDLAAGDLARVEDPVAAALREALDAAPMGVIHWDADDRLVYVNPGYRAVLPWVHDRLRIGMSFAETARLAALAGDMADSDVDAWTRRRLDQRPLPAALIERPLADGRWGLWSDRRTPDGGVVGARIDITDRRQAEAKLAAARKAAEQADQAKTNFIAMMSHELRTPLNAVVGFADLMRQESFGPIDGAEARQALRAVIDSGLALQRLIAAILEFSLLDSGEYQLRETHARLDQLLEDVTQAAGLRAAANGVTVRRGDAPAATLKVDPAAFCAALAHLLDDAVRRTGPGGLVSLSCVVDADGLRVSVAAAAGAIDGAGLLLTALGAPARFDPSSLTAALELDRGGLGFAICRRLLALHGGSVALSEDGSQAVARLPAERLVAAVAAEWAALA